MQSIHYYGDYHHSNNSSVAYIIQNRPMTNAMMINKNTSSTMNNHQNTNSNNIKDLVQIRNELEQVKIKLASKTYECNKLRNQLKQSSIEIEQYKQILSSLSQTNGSLQVNLATIGSPNNNNHNNINNLHGQTAAGSKGKQKKTKKTTNTNCECCCQDADKPYICDWVNCGKRFRQKPHLEAHRNIHTGRRFVCDWPNCGKSFVRKYNLVEHQKLHSAVNPNMCTYPDCGKVFSSKYSLMRHQNAQHNLNL